MLKEASVKANDLPVISSWEPSSSRSPAHSSWVVPCKPPVTQNKLPSPWTGQNNTEMSLFHCSWSYLGIHKSIVSIIAMSPTPLRFFHEGSFAPFHLPGDYYFNVSYLLAVPVKAMHSAYIYIYILVLCQCCYDRSEHNTHLFRYSTLIHSMRKNVPFDIQMMVTKATTCFYSWLLLTGALWKVISPWNLVGIFSEIYCNFLGSRMQKEV